MDYERQALVSFPGRGQRTPMCDKPRRSHNLGNSVSPTTFNIEKSENILEQKQKQNKKFSKKHLEDHRFIWDTN